MMAKIIHSTIVTGAVGVGKTTCLRLLVDSLPTEAAPAVIGASLPGAVCCLDRRLQLWEPTHIELMLAARACAGAALLGLSASQRGDPNKAVPRLQHSQ